MNLTHLNLFFLTNLNNFYLLETVDRVSETQFQLNNLPIQS